MGKKKHHQKAHPAPTAAAKAPEAEAAPPVAPPAVEVAAPAVVAPAEVVATPPPAPVAAAKPASPRTVTAPEGGCVRKTASGGEHIIYSLKCDADFAPPPKPTSCTAEGEKHTWKFGCCANGCMSGRCGVCGEWGQKFCFKVGPGGEHVEKADWALLPNYKGVKHPKTVGEDWEPYFKQGRSILG